MYENFNTALIWSYFLELNGVESEDGWMGAKAVDVRRLIEKEVDLRLVGPDNFCLQRHRMPFNKQGLETSVNAAGAIFACP